MASTEWISRIQATVAASGRSCRVWRADQGQLVVSAPSARILGAALPDVPGNLFWHPPALEDGQSTSISGGDRLWIAPEVAFMWHDLEQARREPFADYRLPPQMDPGEYRILEEAPGHLRLTAQMELTDHRIGKKIVLRVERRINLIDRMEGLPRSVQSLSFSLQNGLTMIEAEQGAVAGAWDILQVPPKGVLVCPVTHDVGEPRSYYDPFGPRHVKSGRGIVRFRVDGKRQIKMGLTAEQTTGRMVYYRKLGDISTLIFRAFLPQPGEPYVDVPRSSEETFGGDALQAYNDNGLFGGFGEMEYHDPALVAGRNPTTRSGSSVTHVMAGPDAVIRRVGRRLLGASL